MFCCCLLVLLATGSALARIPPYFMQSPRDPEDLKRLRSGFEEGLIGTANLPIVIFDGDFTPGTDSVNGKVMQLPWTKLLMEKFLFEDRYMNIRRISLDTTIDTIVLNYTSNASLKLTVNDSRLDFLLHRFSTRFLETFMIYEKRLQAPGTDMSFKDSSSISVDLLTQMFHFAYCEALDYISRLDGDIFNRCPNPCKSSPDACAAGLKGCNPCAVLTTGIRDRRCQQDSQLWRRDYICNCAQGYTWDKATLSCKSSGDFMATLRLKQSLSVGIDTLNVFADADLPNLVGGLAIKDGSYVQFDIKPESHIHPFGHESVVSIATAKRLSIDWNANGMPSHLPEYIVTANLSRATLVDKILVTYRTKGCKIGFVPTKYLPSKRPLFDFDAVHSKSCLDDCLTTADCRYVLGESDNIAGNANVACQLRIGNFSEDELPNNEFVLTTNFGCPWDSRRFCWAMYKTCEYQPPRILVSESHKKSTLETSSEDLWPEVLSTEVCHTKDEMGISHGMTFNVTSNTGDYHACLIYCQSKCAPVMFLSAESCICESTYQPYGVLNSGTFCGRPCPHRLDWTCGGRELFKAFRLPVYKKCGRSDSLLTFCAKLSDQLAERTGKPVPLTNKLQFPSTMALRTMARALRLRRVFGPYYYSDRNVTSATDEDRFHNDDTLITEGVIRIRISSIQLHKCQTFCQASCMRYFSIGNDNCYCSRELRSVIQMTPRTSSICTSRSPFLIGSGTRSIGVHDMGPMDVKKCSIVAKKATSSSSPPFSLPQPVPELLGSISTYDRLYLGCYVVNSILIAAKSLFTRSAADCVDQCAEECKSYSLHYNSTCLCTNDAPWDDEKFVAAFAETNQLCDPHGQVLKVYTGKISATSRPGNPFNTTRIDDLNAYAGHGETYKVDSDGSMSSIGCHAFFGHRFDNRTVSISMISDTSDFQYINECGAKCVSASGCHRGDPSCWHYIAICGPGTCGNFGYCLCIGQAEFAKMRRVSSRLCRQSPRATDKAFRNLEAVTQLLNTSTHAHAKELLEDRKTFLEKIPFLFPGGGVLIQLINATSITVHKTFHYLTCILKFGKQPRLVKPFTKSGKSSCFSTISALATHESTITENVASHGDCMEACRSDCKRHYMMLAGRRCVCFKSAEQMAEGSTSQCNMSSTECNADEAHTDCNNGPHAYAYQFFLPETCNVICQPQFLSQPGFHNISILYSCPQSIEKALAISIRPQPNVPIESTGIFGLTKIDLHSGTVSMPVLTAAIRSSVHFKLNGLFQGAFDPNISLAMHRQIRARYAQWDIGMRTVHYRTFSRVENKCDLVHSVGVLVHSLNDSIPVRCQCRGDYHGKLCNSYLNGCEHIGRADSVLKSGKAACNVQLKGLIPSPNNCTSAFQNDAPLMPFVDFTCRCTNNSRRDTSLPYDNCLLIDNACKNRYCGLGICTETDRRSTESPKWLCLCKPGSARDSDGHCTRRDPIYMFTAWSDWSPCEPDCGPRRHRYSTRRCILPDGQPACAEATADSETTRVRVCRSRACVRNQGEAALANYEELTGDTLDLGSGTVALLAVSLSTSAACGLFLAIVWILSPAMGRRVLEESLWFLLVTRNRLARVFRVPMLLLRACRHGGAGAEAETAKRSVRTEGTKGMKKTKKNEKSQREKEKKKDRKRKDD